MFSRIDSAHLRAVAKAALMTAGVALAGCDQVYSRGDFEALVRDKSDKEVAANIGKPSHIDQGKADQVGWTYTSRTFSIEHGNKRDAKTIVIFGRSSDGTLKAREVLFE